MLWSDVIYLLSTTTTENDMGDPVQTEVLREVYANELQIGQSEFYQAQANGLKPEVKYEVRFIEYQGEKEFTANDITYNIIRTYKNGENIELTGQGLVNKNATT